MVEDCVPDYCQSRVLVLGCGNILFGDDGFGPAVIERLQGHYAVPGDVCMLDVGTGIRDLLCNIALSPVRPRRIVVIDTADTGRKPGQIYTRPIEDFSPPRGHSFSLHQLPTSTLLGELKNYCLIDIVVISVQPESIPEVVCPGLSEKVHTAIGRVSQCLLKNYLVAT